MQRYYTDISSGTVSYLATEGTGPSLLFLHGQSSCGQAFHHQLAYLGQSYHCIALDFLGHGESSAAVDKQAYSLAGCQQQVMEFIEKLKLKKLIVIGHGLGGYVLNNALAELSMVVGLVLIASPPFNVDTSRAEFSSDPTSGLMYQAVLDDKQVTALTNHFVNEKKLAIADWIDVFKAIENTEHGVRPALLANADSADGVLLDDIKRVKQLSIPKMLLLGENDVFIDQDYCHRLDSCGLFVQGCFVMADCQHFPHLEAPVLVNQYLNDFIKACFPTEVRYAYILTKNERSEKFSGRFLPKTKLAPRQVTIAVKATSVNSFDYKMSQGLLPHLVPEFPSILHSDVAGVVIAVGEQVRDLRIGDSVFGCAGGIRGRQGALTEFMPVDEKLVAKIPSNLSFQQAAALPLAGMTAWEGLMRAGVSIGSTVLIHGGTGGVGHLALQLAKYLGAKVYVTVSSDEKSMLAKKLGADEVINYHLEEVDDYVSRLTKNQGFDVVFDTVGNDNLPIGFQACKVGGHVVTTSVQDKVDLNIAFGRRLTLHFINMFCPMLATDVPEDQRLVLNKIADIVSQEQLRPLLDPHHFQFKHAALAHELAASGTAIGKVVLLNDEESFCIEKISKKVC